MLPIDNTTRFILNAASKLAIGNLTPVFGYNGLGEFVFNRTYARGGESWGDVVIRNIEGVMTFRKCYALSRGLQFDEAYHQQYASEMANSMFAMEWLPPGRGLWMMGTDFAYERGATALNNCAFTDTTNDVVHSATWAMDLLMHGCGVGFTTGWVGLPYANVPDMTKATTHVVTDSREGWVDSVRHLLCAYIPSVKYPDRPECPIFDYSKIRAAGSAIRGFGGTASGPESLIELHIRLRKFLSALVHRQLIIPKGDGHDAAIVNKPYDATRFVADVFNAIGACVVAGNVRRSAEIAIGRPTDQTFINLKNYTMHPERAPIGWLSNNTVIMESTEQFESTIDDIIERIAANGEPGIINMSNVRRYGRIWL
jgi:ribonucleoside-triphosphate reductase (thioredoxin)